MQTLFIEAKYKGKITINKKDIDKLPKNIGLATTVQFIDHLDDIKNQLKDKKVFLGKGKQKNPGQILGCDASSAEVIKDKVDAFLYIGTGFFHPIALGLLNKQVFLLDPISGKIRALEKEVIAKYQKRKQGAMIKFLNGKNIGIIVSTKSGQNYPISQLERLEKKYKDKNFYLFVADMIDINQFENYRFIDAWINTACPRIEEDYLLVNISEIQ